MLYIMLFNFAVTGQNGNRWSLVTIRIGKYQVSMNTSSLDTYM